MTTGTAGAAASMPVKDPNHAFDAQASRCCHPCHDHFEVNVMLRIVDHIWWNYA